MFSLSNGTSFKTVNKNHLFHFNVSLIKGSISDWTSETFEELMTEIDHICKSDGTIVIISFNKELTTSQLLKLSRFLSDWTFLVPNKDYEKRKVLFSSMSKSVSGKTPPTEAKQFIQNLFQNNKMLASVIRKRTGYSLEPNKEKLISLLLKLIEIHQIDISEEEIMNLVSNYKSLQEIAQVLERH